MFDFFDKVVFQLAERSVTIAQLVWIVLFLLSWILVFWLFSTNSFKHLYEKYEIDDRHQKKLRRTLSLLLALTTLVLLSWLFKLNGVLTTINGTAITAIHVIKALCIFQAARLLDWTLSNVFINRYYHNREKLKEQRQAQKEQQILSHSDQEKGASRTVQYIVYILAFIFILQSLNLDFTLFHPTLKGKPIDFNISNILFAVLILLVARLAVSLITQIILYGIYLTRGIDEGSQYAINKLIKYVIYVIAIIATLQALGINITLLLGGAAALLVGVGLGLQQTFNDFISGIVLLFERSISVGDVVSIDQKFGIVKKIGLRSSVVETRDNMTVVVPNSKLVNDIVNNWSHYNPIVRFEVKVSVAYGSDTALVKELLLRAVENVDQILTRQIPFVRFMDFGDNGLQFTVFFFSNDHLFNEDIKSDIRFEIDKLFRENNITIPFPQRDVWIRK